MLSGYQVETVGFRTDDDGGVICYGCAVKQYGSLAIEKHSMGLSTGLDDVLQRIIRYEAGEYAGENGYHCGCADELDDIPKDGEAPEGYDGPVDAGYYSTAGQRWVSLPYHEACATFDCDECGEDMAS